MRLSIHWKILFFVIIPIVLMYTSIMAFNILTMRQWAMSNAETRMTELANNYAHRFDALLREIAQVAKMTAVYVESNPGLSSDQIYALLQANLQHNPLVYGSAVAFEPYKYDTTRRLFVPYVYRKGKKIQWVDPSETGYDYTELKQEYWHIPRNSGRAVWTDPYFDQGAGNILMSTYSVPFFSSNKFLGIATIDIPLKPLRELMAIGIPQEIKFSVITKSGKFIYSPHIERINRSISEIWDGDDSKEFLGFVREIAFGRRGSVKSANWESKEYEWIFYSPIKSAMWGFIASIPADIVLQPIQKQFYLNIAFFLLSLVGFVIGLLFFSRKISRPVLQLNKAVKEISNGNLSVRAAVESKDEFGALAGALNEMTHKIAERENIILEGEKKVKTLLSNLPQRIFHKDKNSVYIDCNDNFASDFNILSEQIAGKSDFDFFPMELAEKYRKDDRRIMETGEIEIIEEEYMLSNGQKCNVETIKTPIWNDQGEVTGLLGIFMDISERKKTEEALLKWGHIFETARWGIALGNADGQRFELMNPAYAQMHGYTVDELLEKEIPDVFVPSFREKLPDVIQKCHDSGHFTFEGDHLHKNGSVFPAYHDVTTVKNEKGDALYRIVSILDITERKKAEKEKSDLESQLRQVHKMEAIGTLAGGIAHDFNNILAAILGYAEMVSDDVPESSQAQEDIQEVIRAGTRAKELVKHILAFSRKSEHERAPVAMNLLVKEALKLLRASIPTTIEIYQDINSNYTAILADPIQVHQVIMNLCTNAAQAMDEKGGILKVTVGFVELLKEELPKDPYLKPGPYVHLRVSDNGSGIDKKDINRIFDPYFTTKPVGKGSGMGLAVVHGIVKSHGGGITVDSVPGKGSTFNVFFPAVEKRDQEEIKKSLPLQTGNEHILVVDDEIAMVQMTRERLQRLGYVVASETDSMAALELFRSQPHGFDLVITDQTMPNMTGEQLASELISIQPDIPIVLCTGYSAKIDAEKAKVLGISAFVMKPVDNKELADIIRHVLDGKKQQNDCVTSPNLRAKAGG